MALFNLGCILAVAELSREEFRGEAMGASETCKNVGLLLGMSGGLIADLAGREKSILLSSIPFSLALLPAILCIRTYGRGGVEHGGR
jgi:hypothetical protein